MYFKKKENEFDLSDEIAARVGGYGTAGNEQVQVEPLPTIEQLRNGLFLSNDTYDLCNCRK